MMTAPASRGKQKPIIFDDGEPVIHSQRQPLRRDVAVDPEVIIPVDVSIEVDVADAMAEDDAAPRLISQAAPPR